MYRMEKQWSLLLVSTWPPYRENKLSWCFFQILWLLSALLACYSIKYWFPVGLKKKYNLRIKNVVDLSLKAGSTNSVINSEFPIPERLITVSSNNSEHVHRQLSVCVSRDSKPSSMCRYQDSPWQRVNTERSFHFNPVEEYDYVSVWAMMFIFINTRQEKGNILISLAHNIHFV